MGARKPKPILLAPRNAVREVLAEADAGVMLRSGSWVRVSGTKPITQGAAWQRQFRKARREAGMREFSAWIPADAYDALAAMRRPNESLADVVTRLVKSFDLIG